MESHDVVHTVAFNRLMGGCPHSLPCGHRNFGNRHTALRRTAASIPQRDPAVSLRPGLERSAPVRAHLDVLPAGPGRVNTHQVVHKVTARPVELAIASTVLGRGVHNVAMGMILKPSKVPFVIMAELDDIVGGPSSGSCFTHGDTSC